MQSAPIRLSSDLPGAVSPIDQEVHLKQWQNTSRVVVKAIEYTAELAHNEHLCFAANHTICNYASNSGCSFISENACTNPRCTLGLVIGLMRGAEDFPYIHRINLAFQLDSIKEMLSSCQHSCDFKNPFSRLVPFFWQAGWSISLHRLR